MASAVILAAGASRRMGEPKPLLRLGEQTLLAAHIQALSSQCQPVVVVGGALSEPLKRICRAMGALYVHNAAWETTMPMDSLRCVLKLDLSEPWVVTPVDVPPVEPDALALLLDASGAAALAFEGQPGHPVVLAKREIEGLKEAIDLRSLLKNAALVQWENPDCLLNLNRPNQWTAWLDSRKGDA
jgi:molybdenum cofactor cytidylyltransferase